MSSSIRGVVIGDSYQISRAVTNVPTGETVTKAWFTVKTSYSDVDADAKMQKVITTVTGAGVGQITANVAGVSANLRFDIVPTDWALMTAGFTYKYDIQIMTSGSGIYTVETGTIKADNEVTKANS